jgi:hypothetical protein
LLGRYVRRQSPWRTLDDDLAHVRTNSLVRTGQFDADAPVATDSVRARVILLALRVGVER